MNLAQLQAEFIARLHDGDAPLPDGWDTRFARGLAVYRNNHRHALMEAMCTTFERTRRWVGEAAFARAAGHHLALNPASGWTLDAVGEGFAATASALFARDPEVADLAALEWAMHQVFGAADAPVLDVDGFRRATAAFEAEDWATMRLQLQPGLQVFEAGSDCVALWRALAGRDRPPELPPLPQAQAVVVWREGFRPVACLAPVHEGRALRLAAAGAGYGELCALLLDLHRDAASAAQAAGAMLAGWLRAGMLAAIGHDAGVEAAPCLARR